MEIRLIDDDNCFLELATLVTKMYKSIDSNITEYGAVNTLMHSIQQEDFICIGLFNDNNALVGCTFGHFFNKKSFYFTGIYVILKNNEWTKKLIDYSFDYIRERGYSSWLVDTTNPNISSIIEKYGATPKYTRYQGEL